MSSHRVTPAELAASRIDFGRWLEMYDGRDRRMIAMLASGHTTGETAKELGVTSGRVSQLRREFKEQWDAFHTGAFSQLCGPASPAPSE